jgi:hypothetical protein
LGKSSIIFFYPRQLCVAWLGIDFTSSSDADPSSENAGNAPTIGQDLQCIVRNSSCKPLKADLVNQKV